MFKDLNSEVYRESYRGVKIRDRDGNIEVYHIFPFYINLIFPL